MYFYVNIQRVVKTLFIIVSGITMCFLVFGTFYLHPLTIDDQLSSHPYNPRDYNILFTTSNPKTSNSPSDVEKQNFLEYHNAYENANTELRTLVNQEKNRKSQINCSLISQGDPGEICRAKNVTYKNYGVDFFLKAAQDCWSYKTLRGYYTESRVSDDERNFPLAFSVLVHRDIDGFERLFRRIYRPNNVYCIHVDLKSSQTLFLAISNIIQCFPNAFMVSKREIVVYAGFTRLQADLNCFSDLMDYKWNYLLNYAASELPLRPNNQLVQILRVYNGSNIIAQRKTGLNTARWVKKYETVVNITAKTGSIRTISDVNTPPPFHLTLTKGSAYGMFSRKFVDYVLYSDEARMFIEWCKSTYSPDEHFWATLNNGADNGHMAVPGALIGRQPDRTFIGRHTVWKPDVCHGKFVRHVCVFASGDLPSLVAKQPLVANKFSLTDDVTVVDCLGELLEERSKRDATDLEFYRERVRISRLTNRTAPF